MARAWWMGGVAVSVSVLLFGGAGCGSQAAPGGTGGGGGGGGNVSDDGGTTGGPAVDGGVAADMAAGGGGNDAGSGGGGDAGGGGNVDAGMGGGGDAAMPNALPVNLPMGVANWKFFGPSAGGPNQVFGASYDEGGNLWVAGGEQGLFVMRAGQSTFQRFTMADGLRPYGYMPDGSVPPGDKYLKVISVSGGPAGTVFAGYEGKPPAQGEVGCEDNWDGPKPDPSIYKSGDADKVTLNGNAISVLHYDISSGQGIVGGELRGREKLCNILRIRYDAANKKVWFGGNHGFAMGDANYQGTGKCQWAQSPNPPAPTTKSDPSSNEFGHAGCSGVLEHVHPAINGYANNGSCCVYLTGGYYGVSVDPASHDVWFGGQIRTTKFHYASTGGDYYTAQSQTEDGPYSANRIDVWSDKVAEPNYPTVADRVDDLVSGAAAMNDGSVWVSSFARGLAHIDAGGSVVARLTTADGLATDKLASIVVDPRDQSIWVGGTYGPGISRLARGTFSQYSLSVFGDDLANEGIVDLQSSGSGQSRSIVVSFTGDAKHAGAVGIYTGP